MAAQPLTACDVRTYLNADMLEPDKLELAGGVVAVLSARRPEKTSPNEDAAAVIATSDGGGVLVVADGCGGMASGEEAARIAVLALVEHITGAAAVEGQSLRTAILDGVEAANRQILDLKTGAGATLAIVQLEGGEARPYHVGDSQILLVGGRGKVKMLTTSHSPVGYAVEAGMMEEREAIAHEERHLVSNYLGSTEMHVEVGTGRTLASRDGLMIASDGVLDNLLLDEIVKLLSTGPAAASAAKIAGMASQRMQTPLDGKPHKPDDLTLIVYSQRGVRNQRPSPPEAGVTP